MGKFFKTATGVKKTAFLNFFKKKVHYIDVYNIQADVINNNLDTINNELESQARKLFKKGLPNLTSAEHDIASEKALEKHVGPEVNKIQKELFQKKLGTTNVVQKGNYFYAKE
jgi:hypothetical protein